MMPDSHRSARRARPLEAVRAAECNIDRKLLCAPERPLQRITVAAERVYVSGDRTLRASLDKHVVIRRIKASIAVPSYPVVKGEIRCSRSRIRKTCPQNGGRYSSPTMTAIRG